MGELESLFGIHEQALLVRAQRMDILASNIANAATPGYKARDIDFGSVFTDTSKEISLATTSGDHISASPSETNLVKYRIPVQSSRDGNTVELATEQTVFAENALHYQTTLSFLNGRISTIMRALKGE